MPEFAPSNGVVLSTRTGLFLTFPGRKCDKKPWPGARPPLALGVRAPSPLAKRRGAHPALSARWAPRGRIFKRLKMRLPGGCASPYGEEMRFPRALGPCQTAKLLPPLAVCPRAASPGGKALTLPAGATLPRPPRVMGPRLFWQSGPGCRPGPPARRMGKAPGGPGPKHPAGGSLPFPRGKRN
jgi:hypothetical protein